MTSNGSLKSRLIGLQLTLTIIVLSISWSIILLNDYFVFKDLSIRNVETTVRILSRNLSTCLAFKDKEECQRVLNVLAKEDNTLSAKVVDPTGDTIATYHKPNIPLNQEHFNFKFIEKGFSYSIDDQVIRTTYPIYDSLAYEGRLFIVSSFDLMEIFGKRHAIFFLAIVVGSILVGIGLSTHLQVKISGQINLILATIKKIRLNQDYNLRISNYDGKVEIEVNEFKELAESFNEMIEQIEIKDFEMRHHNENLERLVEEKAQEIYREKAKLIHNAGLASLGEMAGGVAHEINNPLSIIKITTKTLKKMLTKEEFSRETFQQYLTEVDQTVDRIASIVMGLRNLSRQSNDEENTSCQFQLIMNDILGVASERFRSHGVEIRKKFTDTDSVKSFMANRVQLSQVLINLMNNSYDAIIGMEEKWVEISFGIDADLVNLRMTDSGKGVTPKVIEKMFNPFYTTKEIGKGTGIGLSISKSMIERNGGKLFLDSKHANTSFVIQFPYKKGS